jgi:hypothetical protein
MLGTNFTQCMKSMDMRYSSRVRVGLTGRHTCSWCRWFLQEAARAP